MSAPSSVKPFGLSQVYVPRGDPTVDIVYVHGLNGHPHDSWTSKSTNCFWPVDLLPDVLAPLRPRILTYGYNANVTAFTDGASRDSIVSHAETLASSLAANRNVSDSQLYPSPASFCPLSSTADMEIPIATRLLRPSDHLCLPLAGWPRREARLDLQPKPVKREN